MGRQTMKVTADTGISVHVGTKAATSVWPVTLRRPCEARPSKGDGPWPCILRGSQELAPQDDGAWWCKASRGRPRGPAKPFRPPLARAYIDPAINKRPTTALDGE